tara:strand:+ start:6209 stop:6820 length:612 start_codon:yes stop_codon:yes gene_type:complete
MPFPFMAAAGVTSILGGIAGGIGESAAAARRNKQAMQNWMQGEMQKGIDNGKEIFNAVWQEGQQAKVNRSINMGAMAYEYNQTKRINEDTIFQQANNSRAMAMAMDATSTSFAQRGVKGGTSRALQLQNMLNGFDAVKGIEKNTQRSLENMQAQASNMKAKIQGNVFMPNLKGPSARPIMENPTMAAVGGALGGVAKGLAMFG